MASPLSGYIQILLDRMTLYDTTPPTLTHAQLLLDQAAQKQNNINILEELQNIGDGAFPTWQDTLINGSTLLQDNIIDGGGFDFTFNNIAALTLGGFGSGTHSGTSTYLLGVTAIGEIIEVTSGGGGGGDAATLDGQLPSYYLDRTNHTGTQLASTISDFTTAVELIGDADYYPLASNPAGYLTSFTESDPIWIADKPNYLTSSIAASTYVPLTRTVNSLALSSNIVLTTANIADSTNKRYVTDANLIVIGNTSGTNTGDQDLSGYLTISSASSTYQPLDSDLSAIAALATDSFGRVLLTKTSGSDVRTYIGAGTSSFSGAFSALSGIPTTLSGYGITDAQAQLNGTGFVKASGTTISYDNNTYLTNNQAITVTATGDATGVSTSSSTAPSLPLTLATVNSNVGTYGSTSAIPILTINAKGLITAVSNTAINPSAVSLYNYFNSF